MNFSKKWGPYLSDRQWGTVREDYSPDGEAWSFTTHDEARSRAYRWGEEGIGGWSDEGQFLCFAPAFWNGRDAILKERLFGLTNSEGNHGEDVKELYFFLDAAPDHRYQKMAYKYPQAAFPYQKLVEENARRSRLEPEFELLDTGVFDENRYFDIEIEYAKGRSGDDILIQITAQNRGPEAAELTVLPTVWFRNRWAFSLSKKPKPRLFAQKKGLQIEHPKLGATYFLWADGQPDWLFCENETNNRRLFNAPNRAATCKDGIQDFVVEGKKGVLNPEKTGTKAAAFFKKTIAAGGKMIVRLRLTTEVLAEPFADFEAHFAKRKAETDLFYAHLQKNEPSADRRNVQRQAWAGMLWSKQFYFYGVSRWLAGDPGHPSPPASRRAGRNSDWPNFEAANVLSMPDKWEYPWFAAWDLAFQAVVLARLDVDFAKNQLKTLHSDAFRRADGSVPAYEWKFSDLNPPVQAWAAHRIFEIEKAEKGTGDAAFLADLFGPLRSAYDWWAAQKDADGNGLFDGGFLGLDNIGAFDRSQPLPDGHRLEQADATAWAGFFSLKMLRISLELARFEPKKGEKLVGGDANKGSGDASRGSDFYQKQALAFFEDFLKIAFAIGSPDDRRTLWDEADGFFYDALRLPDGVLFPLKIRSLVGLSPIFSVLVLDENELAAVPIFKKGVADLLEKRPDLASMISRWHDVQGEKRLLSMLRGHRLKSLLRRALDPAEFLAEHGVRSLSKFHLQNPFEINWLGQKRSVKYLAGESDSGMFGGNSNWRGPIWMPLNFLLIESLREFHRYFSDDFRVEMPVGSGRFLSLAEVADALSERLFRLFERDANGGRPLHGDEKRYADDPFFRDLVLFYEHFDGETGRGLGASHQTGWTGLAAEL